MGYNVTRKVLLQRQNAALKNGYHSQIVQKLSNCFNCGYRSYCLPYKEGKLSEEEKKNGCKDIREAFKSTLKQLTSPEAFIAKHLADMQVELDLKTLMDGKDEEGLSKDRMRLRYLIKDFLKLMLEYKDTRAKYEVGTHNKVDVIHKFDENETIKAKPEKDKNNRSKFTESSS